MNEEVKLRVAAFIQGLGFDSFALVLNSIARDECVILLNSFPPQLAADVLSGVAAQLSDPEAAPARLN